MKKAVVTGAKGWLGSRLVTHLSQGLPDYPQADPYQVVPSDIEDADLRKPEDCRHLMKGMEGSVLFHTAGIIHPKNVQEFYNINVGATKNLLRAAKEAGVSRAVVVSSNSVCGNNPHPDHLFDEDSPYNPYMNYGRSKMEMEEVVRASGVEYVIVRAPWFYGPNQPPRQTTFFQMIKKGMFPQVGDGTNQRSMAYVDNLCHGLQLAAEVGEAAGEVYWIADLRPYSMGEIIETVGEALRAQGYQVRPNRFRLPWIVGEVATLVDYTLQRFGLYHQKFHVLSEMNKNIAATVEKARNELGYEPKVALFEGMKRSIAWLNEEGLEV